MPKQALQQTPGACRLTRVHSSSSPAAAELYRYASKQMVTRESFVASLDNVSDVNDHYAFIDRHAAAGDREALKEIFLELNKGRPRSRIPDWATGAVLERIIEALALTDGYDNAVAALELAGIADTGAKRSSGRLRPPAVISKIVAAHSPEVIDTLLRRLSDVETTALVLHEAVVRRKLLADICWPGNSRATRRRPPSVSFAAAYVVRSGARCALAALRHRFLGREHSFWPDA